MKGNRLVKGLLLLVIAVVLLAACSKKQVEEEERPTPKPPVQQEEEEEEVLPYQAPFTGIRYEEEQQMRPVLATINNDPKARPQSGLSEADIIYEFITEGNMTRYVALFQSALPDEIGPIRSARDTFVEMAINMDAFYVAHGYSPDALTLLRSGRVDHINGMQYDGSLFKRSADRRAPHNSYISGDSIREGMAIVQANEEMVKFSPYTFYDSIEDVELVTKVTDVTVRNGADPSFTSDYRYNVDTGVFEQSVSGEKSIDKATEAPMEVANVLVIETNYQTIDADGRQKIDILSGGKGLLFQAGRSTEVEWVNRQGFIVPILDGKVAPFVPGKTWVHVIRNQPGLETNVSQLP